MSNLKNSLILTNSFPGHKGRPGMKGGSLPKGGGSSSGTKGKLKEGDTFEYDGETFTVKKGEGVSKDGKRVVSIDAKERKTKDRNRKARTEAESLYEESKKLLDTVSEDPDRAYKFADEAGDLLGEASAKLEKAREDGAPTDVIRMLESAEALAMKCVAKAEEE